MTTVTAPPAHPAANLIPVMQPDEYDQLRADIREHGLQEPIVMLDGQILDGRHRWRACHDENKPITTVEWQRECGTPINYVISKNLKRRQLSVSQRAALAVAVEEYIAATEGKAAQREHGNTAPGRPAETLPIKRSEVVPANPIHTDSTTAAPDDPAPPARRVHKPESADKAGAIVGVSGPTVRRAKRIKREDPALFKRVEAGDVTVNTALRQVQAKEEAAQIAVTPNGARPYSMAEDKARLEFRRTAPDARKITKLRPGDVAGALRLPHERKELVSFLNAMQHWCSLVERAMQQEKSA